MAKIDFEIMEQIGTISEGNSGWKKELNLVSWNGNAPKFDIRDWSPDHTKMGKGLTLSTEDLEALKKILLEMDS